MDWTKANNVTQCTFGITTVECITIKERNEIQHTMSLKCQYDTENDQKIYTNFIHCCACVKEPY